MKTPAAPAEVAKPIGKIPGDSGRRGEDGAEAFGYIAAGEFDTIREDGHRAWKVFTAMGEVAKTGRRTGHEVGDGKSARKGSHT